MQHYHEGLVWNELVLEEGTELRRVPEQTPMVFVHTSINLDDWKM